jgi:glycosyltransferase involved in cell wall biosynthesis
MEERMEQHPQLPTVAFVAAREANDVRAWSGTPYYMARALEAHLGEVISIGRMPAWPTRLTRARARLLSRLGARRRLPIHEELVARTFGRTVEARLASLSRRPDIIFSPAGSALLARLRTNLPIVYSSDTTIRMMIDYHPRFSGLSESAIAMAERIETDAITRADVLLYPTRWAGDSAIRDYGADPAKVHIVPYGANLSEVPDAATTEGYRPTTPDRAIRLLFVGVDWQWKGGPIAIEALAALHEMGIPAELTIVGCEPEPPISVSGVTVVPFLDKNQPSARARLGALYHSADFFILPTRCECYGIAFCEASAYGLPVLATRTGGIPEVVREGVNGFTFSPETTGAIYAECAAKLWREPAAYRRLRLASRREFDERLNWNRWGRETAQIVREFMNGNSMKTSRTL